MKKRAILKIPEPRNKKKLQRFMGAVNNLGKLNHPLRQLFEKDIAWHWGDAQDKSFKELKNAIKQQQQYSSTTMKTKT